jgi:DNA-binding NarL/FixJ family response regulator
LEIVAGARYSVLIVEDERIVAKDLQRTLEGVGYDVIGTAASADETLALCAQQVPDVVLMDIRIKGAVDGIDTAQQLLDTYGLHVIYLTAHSDVASIDRAKRTKPHAYLLKPVKTGELQGAIEIAMFKRSHGT